MRLSRTCNLGSQHMSVVRDPMLEGVWTAAIATVLGFEENATSKSILRAVFSDPAAYKRAHDLGVCLVGYDVFNKVNVQNLYGSQNFGDGYVKWIDERTKHMPLRPPSPPAPPSPPPLPPWQPGTDVEAVGTLPVNPAVVLEAAQDATGPTALAAMRAATRVAARRAERKAGKAGANSSVATGLGPRVEESGSNNANTLTIIQA